MTGTYLISVIAGALFIGYPGTCIAQHETAKVAVQEPVYKYDTAGIRLEGKLTERTFYGPPGFGETPAQDAREKVLVLELKGPITVEPAKEPQPEDIARHIRKVQLFFLPREKGDEARKLLGKMVVAVGTLNEATAPSEHLKVSMTVSALGTK